MESLAGLRLIDQDANDPLDLANRGCAESPLAAEGDESLQLKFRSSTQRLGLRALLHGRHGKLNPVMCQAFVGSWGPCL